MRSIGSPSTFQSRPSVALPTGTRDRPAGVDHVDAARDAVGRVHRDRADAVVAEMLLHLGDQVDRGRPSRSGTLIRSAVLISGSAPVKTASMTTPLISITLPTF